jgi:opacity protein-like surface antigen
MYRRLATLLLAVLPTSAIAADLGGPKEVAPAPASVFRPYTPASCYVQALASSSVTAFKSPGTLTVSGTDFAGVGGIGCDYRIERIVIGAVGRYEHRLDSLDVLHVNRAWTAAARLGYMLNAGTMAYGLVGMTQTSFQTGLDTTDARGLLLGAGLEIDLGAGLALTAEYGYVRMGSWADAGTKVDPAAQQARIGLTYRFMGSPFDR